MSDASDFAALQKLVPREAVAYLQARGRLVQTFNWQDLWQEEHTRAFTVSRLAHADLLQTFSDKITASVQGDLSRTDFMRDMKAELTQAGWWGEKQVLDPQTGEIVATTFDPSRLKLIYDTNVRTAHAAGRWQRFEASRATHPYIRYITMQDERVRASHAAFDGVTLPIDDPFWNTHTPPLGYRCRCRLVAVSKKDYDTGKTPTGGLMRKTAPNLGTQEFVNTRTGEVSQVPIGITPGFGYNPGRAAMTNTLTMAGNKLAGYDARIGAKLWPQLAAIPDIDQWVDEVMSGSNARGQSVVIGAMAVADLDYMTQIGRMPVSAEIVLQDRLLVGRKAGRHATAGDQLTIDEWKALPNLLPTAQAYWDHVENKMIYMMPALTDTRSVRLVVAVDFLLAKPKKTMNAIRSAFKMNPNALEDRKRYTPIDR